MPMARTCPACKATRTAGHYLCRSCWPQLPADARRLLSLHGTVAVERLQQLLDQIHDGTPLPQIRIQ
jgi:hypothetical protein